MALFRMKEGVVVCLLALSVAVTPAHAFTSGSGVMKSETRTLGAFSRVEVSGAVAVEIGAGQPSAPVVVTAEDNLLPDVETTVSGDVLRIRFFEGYGSNRTATVKLATPALNAISAWGAAKITATNLSGERFRLEGNGATKAILSGKVDALSIKLLGAGSIEAQGLEARTADISVIGAGKVDVNAGEKLDILIIGAGKVVHSAQSAVTVSRTIIGAGKVEVKK